MIAGFFYCFIALFRFRTAVAAAAPVVRVSEKTHDSEYDSRKNGCAYQSYHPILPVHTNNPIKL